MASYIRKQALHGKESEGDQFPILCDQCMGDSQYLRMIRNTMGAECKMCTKVYTAYKWKNSPKSSHFKKTVICHVCATVQNICQGCLIDLEFSVPTYVRDSLFGTTESNPNDNTNVISQKTEVSNILNSERALEMIQKGNGISSRALTLEGAAPKQQSIIDAAKSHAVHEVYTDKKKRERLVPPADERIRTLFIGGIDQRRNINEGTIYRHLKVYGPIDNIKMKHKCAFVTFKKRKDAEICAEALYNRFTIDSHSLEIRWAMKKSKDAGLAKNKKAMENIESIPSNINTKKIISQLANLHPGLHALSKIHPKDRPPLPKNLPAIYPPEVYDTNQIPPHCSEDIPPPNYPTLQRFLGSHSS